MNVASSLLLFVAAAIAEIGGAWLVWQGARRGHRLLRARRNRDHEGSLDS